MLESYTDVVPMIGHKAQKCLYICDILQNRPFTYKFHIVMFDYHSLLADNSSKELYLSPGPERFSRYELSIVFLEPCEKFFRLDMYISELLLNTNTGI